MATQCEIDTYINERLDDQIKWYDKKSSSNQRRFKRCKWAEMGLGGIIAVLTPAITACEFIKYIRVFKTMDCQTYVDMEEES